MRLNGMIPFLNFTFSIVTFFFNKMFLIFYDMQTNYLKFMSVLRSPPARYWLECNSWKQNSVHKAITTNCDTTPSPPITPPHRLWKNLDVLQQWLQRRIPDSHIRRKHNQKNLSWQLSQGEYMCFCFMALLWSERFQTTGQSISQNYNSNVVCACAVLRFNSSLRYISYNCH